MGMFKRNILASAASFQGIGAGAEKPRTDEDDTDDMKKSSTEPMDDKSKDGKKDAKKDAKEPKANGDDDDEDDDDEEGDDDCDDRELRDRGSKASSARRRERARVAAILSHPAAAEKQEFALDLALNTDFGRATACRLLDKAPSAATPNTLHRRMESQANRHVGAGTPPVPPQQSIDAGWNAVLTASNILPK